MANRAHHWKATSNVKITTAVQRQMERERVSARIISATPKLPRTGAYQGVIRILAANVSNIIRPGPATARNTPRSSKGMPGGSLIEIVHVDWFLSLVFWFGAPFTLRGTFLKVEHLANFTP